jgi:hypothetical protein
MLAPKIARSRTKPPTKAAEPPSRTRVPQQLARHRFGHDSLERALFLQRTIGNQATLRLLAPQTSRPAVIQRELVVGQDSDPLEHEADRAADQAMRMPNLELSRVADRARHSQAEPAASEAPPIVHEALRSPGQPLDAVTRMLMESRFGHDFSGVLIHDDALAADSARAVRAQAYTVGSDVVFAAGRHVPSTADGQRLLAHELAHVVQQATPGSQGVLQRAPEKRAREGKKPDKEYPAYESADAIMEISRDNDTWSLTVNGFTSAAELVRLIWPRLAPPHVTVTFKVAITDPIERGWFTLTGITYDDLKETAPFAMEPSIARRFAAHNLEDEVTESAAVISAQQAFRAQHQGHGKWVLDAIDVALRRITKRNPELLISYYNYYENHDLKDETHWYSFDGIDFDPDKNAGATARGNTLINPQLLQLNPPVNFPTDDPVSLLASTLLHEYTHTPQPSTSDPVTKAQFEAKAYGVEIFFSRRLGDQKRADFIERRSTNDRLDQTAGGDKIFEATQAVMEALYRLIDNGGPAAQEAKGMSVEFISKNAGDYGPKLKALISPIRYGNLIP